MIQKYRDFGSDRLYNSIIKEAHREVRKYNCRFSADAEKQMQEFISAGVKRMKALGYNNSEDVVRAQRNIRLFCAVVCKQTRRENLFLVDNRTVLRIRLRICPLWPFC